MTILNLSTIVILSHFIHGVAGYLYDSSSRLLSPEDCPEKLSVLESSQGSLTSFSHLNPGDRNSIHISCF